MEGLGTEKSEINIGSARILEVFPRGKVQKIAGVRVFDGNMIRNARIRLVRNEETIFDGGIESMRHLTQNKKILCIGDNLNTDIKGANIQNFNSLFISNGIHKNETKNNLNNLFENYNVKVDYIQSKLKW